MSKSRFSKHECPVARSLDQIGDWWTLLVVREVMYGLHQFNEIRDSLGISRAVLTKRLAALTENGILHRHSDPVDGRAAQYHLTQKGADLWPVILSLLTWANQYVVPEDEQIIRIESAHEGVPISGLSARDENGRHLALHETVLRPGRHASPHMRGRLQQAFPTDKS